MSSALRSVFDVRPAERVIAGLMFTYFFLVITSFWVLKPIKKTIFIGYYADEGMSAFGLQFDAPEAELLAKVSNMLVAIVATIVFSALSRHLRRERLTYVFTIFFLVAYVIFAVVPPDTSVIGVWSFYLFGDLFSTLMVATFFAFLNDSVTTDSAKRLYGVVGFGGVAGGVFGASAVGVWISSLSISEWLAVTSGLALAIMALAGLAARNLPESEEGSAAPRPDANREADTDGGASNNLVVAGAKLVFRSGYLLAIVAIVGLYEIVSTIVDFQFTSTIFEFATTGQERDQMFATTYAITNWVSMFAQLFLTSFVMQRFGLATALVLLPASIAAASVSFLLGPGLMMGSLLSISDNGLSYSINQSSKEALYVPTTVEEKYQAKAFIDMFVQRFAKAVGVGVGLATKSLVVGFAGVPYLSLAILPLIGAWVFAAVYAGRVFAEREQTLAK